MSALDIASQAGSMDAAISQVRDGMSDSERRTTIAYLTHVTAGSETDCRTLTAAPNRIAYDHQFTPHLQLQGTHDSCLYFHRRALAIMTGSRRPQ